MFSKDDPIPEGYLTIDEVLERLWKPLKDQAKFSDDIEQWIQAGLTRSELKKAAEQVQNGRMDEEQYLKLAKQLHREDRREFAANELAVAKIAAALSRGELPTLVFDLDTEHFYRIRPGDWRLMHLKSWTIQRGWLCVNWNEPCARHKGRSVLVAREDAERFLARHSTATKVSAKGGRPSEHDWPGAERFLEEQYPTGSALPEIRDRVIEQVEEWFKKHDCGKAPVRKDIRKRLIAPLYERGQLGSVAA